MSKNIYDWIPELLKGTPNPVIFEIGANTGSDTVKLAAIPGAVIHAFEPEPRCDLSGLPNNVNINRVAVSDEAGEATFNLSDAAGQDWSYSSSLLKPKNHLNAHKHVFFNRSVKVKTIRLDDYCRENQISHIDFIWMDVQGAEAKVFEGATEILKNTRFIYTEYSDDEMYDGQKPLNDLLALLKTYEVVDVWPQEPSNVLLKNNFAEVARKIIIRIDDFPTGVRPILPDLYPFFRIFDEFEKAGVYFYLGIVPELLRRYVSHDDKLKLLSYNYLVPCQHGFDHRYQEMSEKLKHAGDPFNTKTVGTFNEFQGRNRNFVKINILRGRLYLERFFKRPVNHYTPVCNFVDPLLSSVLNELHFSHIFTTENSKVYRGLQSVYTDWSKRLYELDEVHRDCICLHITWEADYIREHGWDAWYKLFHEKIASKYGRFYQKKEVKTAIPHIANFYWNTETPLSYLRYLTLLTFRHFHPEWTMNLWTSTSNSGNVWRGNTEKQDFQQKRSSGKNYIEKCAELGVNIMELEVPGIADLAPNYISDVARFKTIEPGGWFFDLDQIFVRNFDDLCSYDFVTGNGGDGTMYCGVLGASPRSLIPSLAHVRQMQKLFANRTLTRYGEIGNKYLHELSRTEEFREKAKVEKHLITTYEYFYPAKNSGEVVKIYDGSLEIPSGPDNYAVHWYGGHPKSQEFNLKYTPQFAETSNDSISVYLRSIGLV